MVVPAIELDGPPDVTVLGPPCVERTLADVPQTVVVIPDEVLVTEGVDRQLHELLLDLLHENLVLLVAQAEQVRWKHGERCHCHEGLHVGADHVLREVSMPRPDATDVVVRTATLAAIQLGRPVEGVQHAITCQLGEVVHLFFGEDVAQCIARKPYGISSWQDCLLVS